MIPIMNKLQKPDGKSYEICDYVLIRGDSGFQSVDSLWGEGCKMFREYKTGTQPYKPRILASEEYVITSKPATLDAKMAVFLNPYGSKYPMVIYLPKKSTIITLTLIPKYLIIVYMDPLGMPSLKSMSEQIAV